MAYVAGVPGGGGGGIMNSFGVPGSGADGVRLAISQPESWSSDGIHVANEYSLHLQDRLNRGEFTEMLAGLEEAFRPIQNDAGVKKAQSDLCVCGSLWGVIGVGIFIGFQVFVISGVPFEEGFNGTLFVVLTIFSILVTVSPIIAILIFGTRLAGARAIQMQNFERMMQAKLNALSAQYESRGIQFLLKKGQYFTRGKKGRQVSHDMYYLEIEIGRLPTTAAAAAAAPARRSKSPSRSSPGTATPTPTAPPAAYGY